MIFSLLLVIGMISFTNGQQATVFPLVSADSLTNADTVSKVIPVTAGYQGIIINPVVSKVSGTAAGTVVLYQSLDGVNYSSTGDTLSLTNVTTQQAFWSKTGPLPVYYKITGISSGTVVEILRVKYVMRRHN